MAYVYKNGAWTAYDPPKYGVNTTTFTTYPFTIKSPTTPVNATIYGNMSQSGTPTPSSPIQPSECGDLETSGAKAGQYKIPISSAGQTTNVYLGEVETTRKIRKIVLTGEESGTWAINPTIPSGNTFYNLHSTIFPNYNPSKIGYCTHFATTPSSAIEGVYWGANINFITDLNDNIDTPEKWKQYLADQYAADTPVTVWYILATEETGIVNEPIRKIGEYADSVTSSIPVTINSDSVDITTTLKPSAVAAPSLSWGSGEDHKYSGGSWS